MSTFSSLFRGHHLFLFFFIFLIGCSGGPTVTESTSRLSEVGTESNNESETPGTYSEMLLKEAQSRYLSGDFVRAIQEIESLLILEPDSESLWIQNILYYCYMAVGRYKEALTLAKRLVKEKPYDHLSYQQVGLAELWLGKYRGALENFRRSLEFEAHAPQVSFYQGLAYAKLKRTTQRDRSFSKAEKEYLQVLKTNPGDFSANFELARLYLYWKRELEKVPALFSAARSSLLSKEADEDVLQEKGLYMNFHIPLGEGIYLYQIGHYKKSIRSLIQALVSAPTGIRADLAEVYYYLGMNYKEIGEPNRAEGFLSKSMKTDPKGMYFTRSERQLAKLRRSP